MPKGLSQSNVKRTSLFAAANVRLWPKADIVLEPLSVSSSDGLRSAFLRAGGEDGAGQTKTPIKNNKSQSR